MSSTPFQEAVAPSSRRDFFKRAGFGLGAVAVASNLAACDSEDDSDADVTLDFSNDFGVLNYAYALEQLEAAFYNTVVMDPAYATTFSASDRAVFDALASHEAIHRDFLRLAIVAAGGEGAAIGQLTPNFSSIDFKSRTSVLSTAQALEDTGVGAYNGAGRYIADDGYLLIAGKIVSVEARHASVISNMIQQYSIAGSGTITNDTALDAFLTPDEVVGRRGAATPFISTSIRVINVPSS